MSRDWPTRRHSGDIILWFSDRFAHLKVISREELVHEFLKETEMRRSNQTNTPVGCLASPWWPTPLIYHPACPSPGRLQRLSELRTGVEVSS